MGSGVERDIEPSNGDHAGAGAEQERFVGIEVKLAYLEKLTHELNEVVVRQARALDELTKQVVALERQVRADGEGREFPHEPPPHY